MGSRPRSRCCSKTYSHHLMPCRARHKDLGRVRQNRRIAGSRTPRKRSTQPWRRL
jgi:hypothetical protein